MAHKVLIVDDNPFVARLWSRKLSDAGYLVQTAVDGTGARAAVADWRPDLVLLDVVLPDTDGLALCREWRVGPVGADMRIVFVSALTSSHDVDAAYAAGADGYIAKSVDTARVLAARINQILEPALAVTASVQGGLAHGA